MNICITSRCNIYALKNYLDKESQSKIISDNRLAPAVHYLILGLLDSNHNVTVITNHKDSKYLELTGPNLKIIIVKSYSGYPIKNIHGGWLNIKNLSNAIKNNLKEFDIIHSHWNYEYTMAALKYSSIIPVVCTIRDWTPYILKIVNFKDKLYWLFSYPMFIITFLNKNIKLIANSPYTADLIKKRWNINPQVIPNPIGDTFINSDVPEKELDNIFISISASIDERKNIKNLLLAFHLYRKKYPKAKLLLVGPPFKSDNPMVKKWINEDLMKNVILYGRKSHQELLELIDYSGFLIHPSYEETFGNILIEGMSRHIPVIGGINSGAVPFVLDHGNAGVLCDVASSDKICQAMMKVYENKTYQKKIIENAKVHLNNFKSEKITEAHINFYLKSIKSFH